MEAEIIPENFEVIIKEGWLEKRSRFLKGWRKRWIVLTPNYLNTFKTKKDLTDPTEQIPLSEFSSILPVGFEVNRPNVFKIQTTDREFFFNADNQTERDEWVSVLGQIVIHTGLKTI
jgi:PH domain